MIHFLDNPAWHALLSGNHQLAFGKENARYFRRDVSPFAGIPHYTPACFESLFETIPDDKPVGLFTNINDLKAAPWKIINQIDGYQMLFSKEISIEPSDFNVVSLTTAHVPQMLALTGITHPGPFLTGTIDFGGYEGIFLDDQLIAMAGRRFHSGSYVEISAVCTHPDHVGNGYARHLIQNQIRHIQSAGHTAYLHVRADNSRAVAIYQKMGFAIHQEMFIHILSKG